MRLINVAVLLFGVVISGPVNSDNTLDLSVPEFCGSLQNAYGPFDYTNPEHFKEKLPIVERNHFTGKVERLVEGQSGALLPDIAYTLRAFPNHHKALYAMSRYQLSLGKPLPYGDKNHIECYFRKALKFKPDDAIVYMLYGIHRYKQGKLDEALELLKKAEGLEPNAAEIQYNLGLVLYKAGNYKRSLEHAKKAYSQNYPLKWLKDELISIGVWEK